ncbi:CBN-CYP-33C9 protein [Aphelenchoides avenae]|nr:CBN-CYP-33C9 protein [Aphelenchus avenae]
MALFWIVELLLALATVLAFYNFYWKRRNLPPGPTPLPFVGNMLTLAKAGNWEDAFVRWKKQYGAVYTYWLAELPVVAVNDYPTIVETFQKDGDTYAGREHNETIDEMMKGGMSGVIFAEGELWRDQRRFALHVLRDFGLGKGLMQERVIAEVSALTAKILKNIDSGIMDHDLPGRIDVAVGSVINALLFGYRWDDDKEQEFFVLKKLLAKQVKSAGCPAWTFIWAFTRVFLHLPYFKQHAAEMKANFGELEAFSQRQIDEHEKHIDFETDSQPLDYAEAFLREKRKRDKAGGEHFFTYHQLRGMCADLFAAGQETTSTTLAWGFAYILHAPEVQKPLHDELDRVIGSDRLITMDDRSNLHYTNAVIMEIQRLCNLLQQNLLHRTTRDVTVGGHLLPKGTTIVPQISTIHYDGQIFPNPKRFDPERFLDQNGRFKPMAEVFPFSIGKRQCLGESLARMELFLFLANLLNHFKFSAGSKPPSLKRSMGLTVPCQPYTVRIAKRHA